MTHTLDHPATPLPQLPSGLACAATPVWPAALDTAIERAKDLIARATGIPAACPGKDAWIV